MREFNIIINSRGYDGKGSICDKCKKEILIDFAVVSYDAEDEDGETQKIYCLSCGRKEINEDMKDLLDVLRRIAIELGEIEG